jgi:predicted dinucleotide-binding enzyme
MNVTIAGTGNMARAIATRALAGGHEVSVIGTHISKAEDLADELTGQGPVRAVETVDGDILVLAVPYSAAPHVVRQHAPELDGTVVIDITNPVGDNFEPLDVELGSGAQVIAAAAPDGAPVVKAFNTTFAGTLMAGAVAGQPLDVFIAGDDEAAKAKVARLVEDGGLRPIDAGPLRRARELEAAGFLHMAIQHTRDTLFASALKVLP